MVFEVLLLGVGFGSRVGRLSVSNVGVFGGESGNVEG